MNAREVFVATRGRINIKYCKSEAPLGKKEALPLNLEKAYSLCKKILLFNAIAMASSIYAVIIMRFFGI